MYARTVPYQPQETSDSVEITDFPRFFFVVEISVIVQYIFYRTIYITGQKKNLLIYRCPWQLYKITQEVISNPECLQKLQIFSSEPF